MSGVTVSSPVTASPGARRVKTPSWFDARLAVGIVLVLGSVLIGARALASANHRYRMVAVTHSVAAGTILRRSDVHAVEVQLPDHGRRIYVSDQDGAVGKQLNRPLVEDELVPAAALGTPAELTTVTIPFAADAAPKLSSGQRIKVWLSTKTCPSVVLLADVTVQSVHGSGGGSFAADEGQFVVVSVPPPLAGRVVDALAQDGGTIRAGVLTGPAHSDANDALPDLTGCRSSGS